MIRLFECQKCLSPLHNWEQQVKAGGCNEDAEGDRKYLEEEDDIPDESKDDGGVSISDVDCIDADQLHLEKHINPALTNWQI